MTQMRCAGGGGRPAGCSTHDADPTDTRGEGLCVVLGGYWRGLIVYYGGMSVVRCRSGALSNHECLVFVSCDKKNAIYDIFLCTKICIYQKKAVPL